MTASPAAYEWPRAEKYSIGSRSDKPDLPAPSADGRTLFMLTADWHMDEGFENNLHRLTTGPRTGQVLTSRVSVPGAGWPNHR